MSYFGHAAMAAIRLHAREAPPDAATRRARKAAGTERERNGNLTTGVITA